jgi:hypothetical protein
MIWLALEQEAALITLSALLRQTEVDLEAIDHYETDLTHYPEYGSMVRQPQETTP